MTGTQTNFSVTVLHLRFLLQAETVIHLGPQAGAQIRGALWAALREFACTSPGANPKELAEHSLHCPMCRLMHLETQQGVRGMNPARPFAVRPPLSVHPEQDRLFDRGDTFQLGISLFGDAYDQVGYVAKAVHRMGQIGIGYGRGRFTVRDAQAVNLLDETTQALMQKPGVLSRPTLVQTASDTCKMMTKLDANRLHLRFLTPTTLTSNGQTQTYPDLPLLIGRLLERCQSLEAYYTPAPQPASQWRERHLDLIERAKQIRSLVNTRWVKVESGSRRTTERSSMGGFVGEMSLTGDLSPFLEWIVWGTILHVGKNVVKGNGWYEILT